MWYPAIGKGVMLDGKPPPVGIEPVVNQRVPDMPRLPPELSSAQRRDGEDPLAHLGQVAHIAGIDGLGSGEWTTLYEYENNAKGSRCSYSALLTSTQVADALKQKSWDLSIGHGAPGFTQRRDDGVEVTTYDRFGVDGVEPLIYVRDFHGIKPRQFDLSEEFRLFHNLYYDRHNDRYIHVDDRGNEVVAVEIGPGRVRVLNRLVRQYLAARQLALALFFDHRAHSGLDLATAESALSPIDKATEDRCYSFNIGEIDGKAFSLLVGKRIVSAPPVTQCGVWPYEADKQARYVDFVIGVDEYGNPLLHSCDPDGLANYFGANEHAPHYLTPVWFTRDVLSKYYDQPSKFSVEDGYLRCGSLWGIQIDNNIPDHVVVYLGDLGRDLHYEEQAYWRHYNVTPSERQPSETNFRRSFLAEFADPSAPDLVFKQRYAQLNEVWLGKLGWPLFRTPHEGDSHVLTQFRVPVSESPGEFENQVLFLVKLVIDSLNEAELAKACGGALANEQGIGKLERYLKTKNYPHLSRDVSALRLLQRLRSAGVAHRKGENFDKVRISIGLDRDSHRDVFRNLLAGVNQMLSDLSAHFFTATD
jgi:hypothetical protein